MESKLLNKYHIPNFISGMENDLREQNVGDGLKDNIETVLHALDIQPGSIYTGRQCHGSNVEYATGKNGEDYIIGRIFDEADGVYTDQPGTAMWVKFADCTPVVLYDPKNHALAILHSGWRGTVKRISEKALRKMAGRFGTKAEDVIAYVGPSIGQDDYEVGPEVYEAFEEFDSRDDFFYQKGEKYHLHMVEANVSILRDNGLLSYNVEVAEEVTLGNPNLHSSREEGEGYGLNAMLVMLPEKGEK